jgi:hypothetical protein
MLVAEADLVVYGRLLAFEEASGAKHHGAPFLGLRVKVLGVIKGVAEVGSELRFIQHGHGVPQYRPGQTALLFLRDLSLSRELRALRSPGELEWYSNQEQDDQWVLTAGSREGVLSAARRYVTIEVMPVERRAEALHGITVRLLSSGNVRLARSALRDLAVARDAPLIGPRDVPWLLGVVGDARMPVDVRAGILAELDQRGLVRGDEQWARLIRTTHGPDRLAAIPLAGAHLGPAVQEELEKILSGPDVISASAAAVALGQPGNEASVPALSRALGAGQTRVALSAIRGLSVVGTPEAWGAIRDAAASHPDEAVRRRARAALDVGQKP